MHRQRLVFIFFILGMVIYHTCTVGVQSFFTDEVEELRFAHGDFWESFYRADSMPPLFTTALRCWLRIFGSDMAARWLSVCATLTAIASFYWYAIRRFPPLTSLTITLLIACSPLTLYYGQLIRGYSLLFLVATICIIAWDYAIRMRRSIYWCFYGLTLVVGMYTFYYFVIIPFVLTIVLLLNQVAGKFRTRFSAARLSNELTMDWRAPILTSMISAVICLPLIPLILIDFQYQRDLREPRPLTIEAVGYTDLALYSGYSLGPSQRELHSNSTTTYSKFFEAAIWLSVIVSAQIILLVLSARAWRSDPMFPYLLGLVLIPLPFLGLVGSVTGITYNVRFVCWLVVPVSMLIGRGLEAWPTKIYSRNSLAAALYGILIAISLFANYNRVYSKRYQFEDMRSVAAKIHQLGTSKDQVFVVSDYLISPLSYYLNGFANIQELPYPGEHSKSIQSADEATAAYAIITTHNSQRIWFVYSRPFHGDPNGQMLRLVQEKHFQLVEDFAGVSLYTNLPLGF